MANTIPDVRLVNTSYMNLYSLTGIPPGTPLAIQNKQNVVVYIQISPTQPDVTSRDGFLLAGNEACIITSSNISNVWAWGSSRISVQVLD